MRYALLGIVGGLLFGFAAPAAAPASYPQLKPAAQTDLSYNWAGYQAEGGPYTAVSGRWIVPDVAAGNGAAADAAWVGIGGIRTDDLIQAGTQAIVDNGRVHYQAWYELLPAPSIPVPLSISPGDEVEVTIRETAPQRWEITMRNATTGGSYRALARYDSSGSSAEWIEEMPASLGGRFIPLSQFGSVRFLGGTAALGSTTLTVAQAGGTALSMINRRGEVLAAPSVLSLAGGFVITRTAAAPIPQRSGSRYAPPRGTYR